MQNKLSILIVLGALSLAVSACTQEQGVLNKPPGTYEKETSTTDANGTTTNEINSTNVMVDKNGKKKAVVKSKTTSDPKGLFNKTTTEDSTQVIKEQ